MQMTATFSACSQLGNPRINIFSPNAIPGNTKVSFKQWYHEVQCVKDHYPKVVVWESIIWLLKGPAADMARYMGPTTSVAHILWKVSIIFGTVASSDILKQNFYKVTQGNNEKVPFFMTQLDGTLNWIQIQCPGRVADLEAQQHCLFHGVHKHIYDSV